MNKSTEKIIENLKLKYKNNADAMDEINRAKETIEYHEKNRDIDKAIGHAKQFEAFLHDWY